MRQLSHLNLNAHDKWRRVRIVVGILIVAYIAWINLGIVFGISRSEFYADLDAAIERSEVGLSIYGDINYETLLKTASQQNAEEFALCILNAKVSMPTYGEKTPDDKDYYIRLNTRHYVYELGLRWYGISKIVYIGIPERRINKKTKEVSDVKSYTTPTSICAYAIVKAIMGGG